MTEEEVLTRYYLAQAGAGSPSFYSGPIYQRGNGVSQRGSGIGSYLGGLIRRLLPILRKGTIALGKEVINNGSKFIMDLGDDVNLNKKVMHGEGYKKRTIHRKRQSTAVIQTGTIKKRKVVKKKKKTQRTKPIKKRKISRKRVKDIFSN